MSVTTTIRDATLEDCGRLAELVEALAEERGEDGGREQARAAAVACVEGSAHDIVVAEIDGRVVGYIAIHWVPFPMLHGYEAYISDLLIDRRARGHGVGSLLLADAERRARERGCQRVMLNNRMLAESFKRGFFARAGFRRRGDFASFVKVIGAVHEPDAEPA